MSETPDWAKPGVHVFDAGDWEYESMLPNVADIGTEGVLVFTTEGKPRVCLLRVDSYPSYPLEEFNSKRFFAQKKDAIQEASYQCRRLIQKLQRQVDAWDMGKEDALDRVKEAK